MIEYPPDFVLTRNAGERINKIKQFTGLGIPVLLEGPTGSAKTTSAKLALNNPDIVSCSSETSVEQLLGRVTLDSTGNEVTKFEEGPYTKAFRTGGSLIIDEINLAPPDVLQCIEASLDSGSLELNSVGQNTDKSIKRHPDFKLVATMNPPNEDYVKNRNKLLNKFQSKFKIINFDNFDKIELKEIIEKKVNDNNTVTNFIKFHEFCYKRASKEKSYRCFTVRDINLVLNCVSDDIPLELAIYVVYCLCFSKQTREQYEEKYKKYWPEIPQMLNDNKVIDDCIRNKILSRTLATSNLLSIRKRQPLLLIGDIRSGKTSFARWLSMHYHVQGKQPKTVICTPETTNADLLGKHTIDASKQSQFNNVHDTWVDGPVIRAITEGSMLLLDNINNAPSQVIERLNSLIDKAYLPGQSFIVNERPNNKIVEINDDFRIVATASRESIKQMSPALINRFAILFIDNQFEDKEETNKAFSDYIDKVIPSKSRQIVMESLLPCVDKINVIECINLFSKIKGKYKDIKDKSIISFSKNVFLGTNEHVDDDLTEKILKSLKKNDTKLFHFKDSPKIKQLIASLIALYNAGKHVVLQSQTGFGKTSAAEALGEIIDLRVFKVAFNNETQIGELFGNYTISDKGFDNKKGPLAESMSKGGIFIADELNLAEASVLKSLRIAIEPKEGDDIELPNNEKTVTVSPNYFFIGCQNDITMNGRRQLPTDLSSKIVMLKYPQIDEVDIKNILKDIVLEMNVDLMVYLQNTTDLIMKIRSSNLLKSKPWSFREARRFLRRILYFKKNESIKPYHHACFMILSVHDNENDELINEVHRVVSESFRLDETEKRILLNDIKSDVIVNDMTSSFELQKGSIRIITDKVNINPNLKQVWKSYFNILMTHPQEPILICGPSGYKEYIAKLITINNFTSVNLSKDSTTSSLIGSINLTDRKSVITMLFDILSRIDNSNTKFMECNEIKNSYFAKTFNQERFENFIDSIQENKNETFVNVIKQIRSNIVDIMKQNDNFSTFLSHYITIFKPGLITSAILQQKALILKNFSHPPISVIERLNELFSITPELTLSEDFTNTIVSHESQTIRVDKFRVFATTTTQEKSKLSEAMLSRLTVVKTYSYSKDDYQYIFDPMFWKNLQEEYWDNMTLNQKFMINNIAKRVSDRLHDKDSDKCFALALNMMNMIPNNDLYEPLEFDEKHIISRKMYVIPNNFIEPKTKLVQTKSINAITNLLFSAAKMKYSSIIQGLCGTGKSTVIKYLSEIFDADLITVRISSSTTVEHIYGQNELVQKENGASFNFKKTALLEKITGNSSNGRPVWVILEEIDQASDSLIDSLIQLFDSESNQILLPNGSTETKNEYIIFGLSSKQFYNESILNNAVCFEQEDYSEEEFVKICEELYINNSNFANDEIKNFPRKLYGWKKIAKEKQISFPITIRTFKNFINSVKQNPNGIKVIENQIYKSIFDENLPNINKENEEDEPQVSNEDGYVSINGNRYPYYIQDERKQSLIQNLTYSQKMLFTILSSIIDKHFPIIIQGKTASGKTHTMNLFAEAMAQELVVLQLNVETSDSIVYGGYKPLSELRQTQITEISAMLEEIKKVNNQVKKIQITEWTPNYLRKVVNQLTEIKDITQNQNQIQMIDNLNNKIINDCQFYNLIDKYDSIIVKAMNEGKWLLLDGIEACPGVILDRLITLFSSSPRLDLYEKGTDNEIIAKQNFRVFMTYNPYEATMRQKISQSLLNRCFVYTLDPIDHDFNDSFNVIFGIISQVKNTGFTSTIDLQKLVARLINVHLHLKSDESNIDGRTLVRLTHSLEVSAPLTRNKIIEALEINYSNKLDIDDKLREEIVRLFDENVDEEKLKRFKNAIVRQSTELESLMNTLIQFHRNQKISIEIFIKTFLRLPFENYETLQKELTFNNQYCDIFKLIYNFIDVAKKTIQNDSKLEGKSLDKIKKGEFEKFDDFLLKIETYLYLINQHNLNQLKYTANDLILLHKIDSAKQLNDAFYYLLSMSNFTPAMFLPTSYMNFVARSLSDMKDRGYKIILLENPPEERLPKTAYFYFKNKIMDSIYCDDKVITITKIEPNLNNFFTTILGTDTKEFKSYSDRNVSPDFRKTISFDYLLILYTPIFLSPRDVADIFKDYAKESIQITYDIIAKQKDFNLYQQWAAIISEISTIMQAADTTSLSVVDWSLRNNKLLDKLLSFEFDKFSHCKSFKETVETLKKEDVRQKRNKRTNKSAKEWMQDIQRYINRKEKDYEVLEWAKDNNAFDLKTKPSDLAIMIDRANIQIYPKMDLDFETLGDLHLSKENNDKQEDMTWFYHYCKYSYESYLLKMMSEGSFRAAMIFSDFYEGIKMQLYDIFSKGNTMILDEYHKKIVTELFENLSEHKDFILKSNVIRALNKLSNPSDFVSKSWKAVLAKINKMIPLEIPFVFPEINESTISSFIEASIHMKGFEILERFNQFMEYRKQAIKDPPQSFSELSEVIHRIDPNLVQFAEFCHSIENQKEVEFNFNDTMLYRRDLLEFAPFLSILLNKNPEMKNILNLCLPNDDKSEFRAVVGLFIIRLFANNNLISVNTKINQIIHNLLKEIVDEWFKAPSQFIVDYIMIVGNYNVANDHQYDYNLPSYLNDEIEKIAKFIMDSNYTNYFLDTLKVNYPVAIRKFIENKYPQNEIDEFFNEDGEKNINEYLVNNFTNLLKSTLGYTRNLYEFIEQFTDKEEITNNKSIVIFGCLTSISQYVSDQNIDISILSDYCKQLFSNFDIQQFKTMINNPDYDNKSNDPFWNPLGCFTEFYKRKLNEDITLDNAELNSNQDQLERFKKTKYYESMQQAILEDKKQFIDQYNSRYLRKDINDLWIEYSHLAKTLIDSIPRIDDPNATVLKQNELIPNKVLEKIIPNPLKYQNSMKYTLIKVKKNDTKKNYIEIIDLTSCDDNNTFRKSLDKSFCILQLSPGKRLEDFEIKDCEVEKFDFYIERNAVSKTQLKLNELSDKYYSIKKDIKKNSNHIIFDYDELDVKFGDKTYNEFIDVLKSLPEMEINEFVKIFRSFGLPTLEYDRSYSMKNTINQFNMIKQKLEDSLNLMRINNKLSERLKENKTKLSGIKDFSLSFNKNIPNPEPKIIDFDNIKEETLFAPNIVVKGSRIESSFKNINIELVNVPIFAKTPFQINIPVIGRLFDYEISIEGSDEIKFEKTKNAIALVASTSENKELKATLKIKNHSIPIFIKYNYIKSPKIYIISPGNDFVDLNGKMFFKSTTFVNEKIPLYVEDETGTRIAHTLTFKPGQDSKQKIQPIYNYDTVKKESYFSFPTEDYADMLIYVNISGMNSNVIKFKSKIIERPIVFKTWNISSNQFEKECNIWAGELLCEYAFQFETYTLDEKEPINIKVTPSSNNILLKMRGDLNYKDNSITYTIFNERNNKIAHQIPFSIAFNKREDKIENLSIEINYSDVHFKHQIDVVPCYIKFSQTNDGVCFLYDTPNNNRVPSCKGKYYDMESAYPIIAPNNIMPIMFYYHVITPFSYNVYSNYEPNSYALIGYNKFRIPVFTPYIYNLMYFVIEPEGKYYYCHRTELPKRCQIICGRLGQDNIKFQKEDNDPDKWQLCWFPYSDNLDNTRRILEQYPHKIMGIIDKIMKFIRLPQEIIEDFQILKEKYRHTNNLIDFIMKQFQYRLDALNRQKGHLRVDADMYAIFEERNNLQVPIQKLQYQYYLNKIDFDCKRNIRNSVQLATNKQKHAIFNQILSENRLEYLFSDDIYKPYTNQIEKPDQNSIYSEIDQKIKILCDNAPVNSIIKSYFEITRDTKGPIIQVSDFILSIVSKPEQSDNNLKIINNSEFSASSQDKKNELQDLDSGKSIGQYVQCFENYLNFCNNFPNVLRSIKSNPTPEDKEKANASYEKLAKIDGWAKKIVEDGNNSLILIANNYHQYFSILENLLFHNNDDNNACFVIPKSIAPKIATVWEGYKNDTPKIKQKEESHIEITNSAKSKENNASKSQLKIDKNSNEGKGVTKIQIEGTTDEIQKSILETMKLASRDVILKYSTATLDEDSTKEIMDQQKDISGIDEIIKCALPLAISIVNQIYESKITLGNRQVAVFLDSSSTIGSEYQRNATFSMFVSLALALEYLHIPSNLYVFCDTGFQFYVKSSKNPLKKEHIQAALDAFCVFRKLSNIGDALSKMKKLDVSTVFVITDGFLYNLHDTEGYRNLLKDKNIKVNFLIMSTLEKNDLAQMKICIDKSITKINEHNPKLFVNYIEELANVYKRSDDISSFVTKGFLSSEEKFTNIHNPKLIQMLECEDSNYEFKDIDNPSTMYSSRYNETLDISVSEIFNIPAIDESQFIIKSKKSKEILFKGYDQIKSIQTRISNSFEPNKPTQFSQSTKGSNISIKGYIQFLVTQGQEQRIYLERNAGLVLSHSLFVVIDGSISCFNEHVANLSLQTIICTLSSLKLVDFDNVTIFISKGNDVIEICHEVQNTDLFAENSPLWNAIISICTSPSPTSDIVSALSIVDDIRVKQQSKQSLCLCFTDCMLSSQQMKGLGTIITQLESRRADVYAVGIGLNPSNIEKGFKYSFWSMNPLMIILAIAKSLRGQFNPNEILPFIPDKVLDTDLKKVSEIIQNCIENHVYKDIYNRLDEITRTQETFSYYYNDEASSTRMVDVPVAGSGTGSPTNTGSSRSNIQTNKPNTPLMIQKPNEVKDLGKGKIWDFKILICQFWDYCMMPAHVKGESEYISKKTLENPDGIIESLKGLGIKCEIVQNYKKAIECMTSGQFSQVWVICGRGENKKPDELNENGTSYLIDQFIDCLIQFHKHGGSLLISGDNNPLTYELNKFLEKVELDGIKPQFSFSVNEDGGNMLMFGDIDSENAQLFDQRSVIKVAGNERPLYGFNVKTLFEGTTISCAPGDADIKPFQPFIISKEGNYANMYYMAPSNNKCGDIILDGSFTRFFNELHEEGTLRLVRNIAVWLQSVERRERLLRGHENAIKWKVKEFVFPIKNVDKSTIKFNKYSSGNSIDICLVVDATKSMNADQNNQREWVEKENERSMIKGAKSIFKRLMDYTKSKYSDITVRYSAVFFRDEAMADLLYRRKEVKIGTKTFNVATVFDFKSNGRSIDPVKFDEVMTNGGAGDGPEDWVQAFSNMLDLQWDEKAKKIMIMITDSSCHGDKFDYRKCLNDKDIEINHVEGPKVERLIKEIAERKIDVCFITTSDKAKKGMKEFKKEYEEAGGTNFKTIHETFTDAGQELKDAVSNMITGVVDTAVASFNTSRVKETKLDANIVLPKRKKRQEISLKIEENNEKIEAPQTDTKKRVSGIIEVESSQQNIKTEKMESLEITKPEKQSFEKYTTKISEHQVKIQNHSDMNKKQKEEYVRKATAIPPKPQSIQIVSQSYKENTQPEAMMNNPASQRPQLLIQIPLQKQQLNQLPPQQQMNQLPPQQQLNQLPPQQQQQMNQLPPQQQQQLNQLPPQQQQQMNQLPPQQQQQMNQLPPQQQLNQLPPQQQQQMNQLPPQQQQQMNQLPPQQQLNQLPPQQQLNQLPPQQQQQMNQLPPQQQQQLNQFPPQQQFIPFTTQQLQQLQQTNPQQLQQLQQMIQQTQMMMQQFMIQNMSQNQFQPNFQYGIPQNMNQNQLMNFQYGAQQNMNQFPPQFNFQPVPQQNMNQNQQYGFGPVAAQETPLQVQASPTGNYQEFGFNADIPNTSPQQNTNPNRRNRSRK
ncbi:hypothetical protein TVAG_476450 [Trichomonas vaginalis G3]|uniref:AAA+ ATPase domain-containing protein n=1 Tax=Trichomonas vaginalis (strain ATCC PRA-98 / G3) TaxID=412133 RepID=A2DA68_TRIV3|nr:hypothetical protein TVAG_476450 [Trichomonas vaginalis G3]|eukprot:XP_001583702.1 hypothetical protein [Trichomonas vaginalis G3]